MREEASSREASSLKRHEQEQDARLSDQGGAGQGNQGERQKIYDLGVYKLQHRLATTFSTIKDSKNWFGYDEEKEEVHAHNRVLLNTALSCFSGSQADEIRSLYGDFLSVAPRGLSLPFFRYMVHSADMDALLENKTLSNNIFAEIFRLHSAAGGKVWHAKTDSPGAPVTVRTETTNEPSVGTENTTGANNTNNGTISFLAYATCLSLIVKGTLQEKISFVFEVLDVRGEGQISAHDFFEMMIIMNFEPLREDFQRLCDKLLQKAESLQRESMLVGYEQARDPADFDFHYSVADVCLTKEDFMEAFQKEEQVLESERLEKLAAIPDSSASRRRVRGRTPGTPGSTRTPRGVTPKTPTRTPRKSRLSTNHAQAGGPDSNAGGNGRNSLDQPPLSPSSTRSGTSRSRVSGELDALLVFNGRKSPKKFESLSRTELLRMKKRAAAVLETFRSKAGARVLDDEGLAALVIDNNNLIKRGLLDLNKSISNTNLTILHVAVSHRSQALIKALIQRGADINAQDLKGNSPMHYAVEHGNKPDGLAVISLLVTAGANLDIKNHLGIRPLQLAPTENVASFIRNWAPADKNVEEFDNSHVEPCLIRLLSYILYYQFVSDRKYESSMRGTQQLSKSTNLDSTTLPHSSTDAAGAAGAANTFSRATSGTDAPPSVSRSSSILPRNSPSRNMGKPSTASLARGRWPYASLQLLVDRSRDETLPLELPEHFDTYLSYNEQQDREAGEVRAIKKKKDGGEAKVRGGVPGFSSTLGNKTMTQPYFRSKRFKHLYSTISPAGREYQQTCDKPSQRLPLGHEAKILAAKRGRAEKVVVAEDLKDPLPLPLPLSKLSILTYAGSVSDPLRPRRNPEARRRNREFPMWTLHQDGQVSDAAISKLSHSVKASREPAYMAGAGSPRYAHTIASVVAHRDVDAARPVNPS